LSVRHPVVAGAFYPSDKKQLLSLIESCFKHDLGPRKLPGELVEGDNICSIVSPHAGYIYSGPVAAHGYLELSKQRPPETVIVIGPNHTGFGKPISMWGEGVWSTPLGKISIDEELAKTIYESTNIIEYDKIGHLREHSIEVQVPFLQYIYDEFKLLPFSMGSQDLETSIGLGEAIAEIVKDLDVIIIASTDLTHQEKQRSANLKDNMVINAILDLDEVLLQNTVYLNRITMCGYGPVSASLTAAKKLDASNAELLAYNTSGDITGDFRSVVGYASIKITK
jgi:AmmeMemoRadiSam system protein B